MKKNEYAVCVTAHDGRNHKRKYWAPRARDALNMALSEAYPFGIKLIVSSGIDEMDEAMKNFEFSWTQLEGFKKDYK